MTMSKTNLIHAVALFNRASEGEDQTPATWTISVQPKKTTNWLFHTHHPHTSMFASNGKIHDVADDNILLKVLISENHTPAIEKKVEGVLRRVDAKADSESWLHDAMQALQRAGLVERFSVPDFRSVAMQHLAAQHMERVQHGSVAPLEIDCQGNQLRRASQGVEERVAMLKQKEKKKTGGFWISYGPHATLNLPKRERQRYSWEREDDAYGGLM